MKQDAIVSGILARNHEVMLAKRASSKKIAPGMYHLPGGHIEFGEEPEAALIREFKEEFDLDISAQRVVRAFSYMKDDLHTVGITYEVRCGTIPETIRFDTHDTEEIAWVSRDNYEAYVGGNPSDHDLITLRRYFAS